MDKIKLTVHSSQTPISLSRTAQIAGLGLLIMALTVPFAEFYIFPKLIGENPAETTKNIVTNKILFTSGIFLHFITLLCDIIVAWALYLFFKPVHKGLSLLAAWFRLTYTAMYLVALSNLMKTLNLINQPKLLENCQQLDTVVFFINSFKLEWSFGLIIFGSYLLLLGYLIYRSAYVPKVIGVLVLLAGLGYVVHTLGIFFSPETNLDLLFITFFGELIFMVWLLVRGSKI
ncbi:DUF4386 domain-containing protein [Maribacter arcticus]|uniref:DUF4386 domain-containing protein n=1 Tax=Maribacter arcticus TaxID=561365 RepID=UPI0030DBFD6D|tara:strand:- start:1325 stop:2017 length:693 start_codon:yes stop_codon:yes gene_type:complete